MSRNKTSSSVLLGKWIIRLGLVILFSWMREEYFGLFIAPDLFLLLQVMGKRVSLKVNAVARVQCSLCYNLFSKSETSTDVSDCPETNQCCYSTVTHLSGSSSRQRPVRPCRWRLRPLRWGSSRAQGPAPQPSWR